ncbi:MAG: rhodanese-like domain-containing protein [Bacteriovoracales bacterium]
MNLIKFFFITLCFSIFAQYEDLAKSAFQDIQKHGAILLDVREKSELEEGMAKGAKSIPISQVKNEDKDWKNFLKETPKEKSIYVYCSAGGRAGKVTNILKEKGYIKVVNIGGLKDWKKAGLPVVKK